MTRSIGDLAAASVGVTSEPEIQVFNCLTTCDRAIVIASDGLWDRLSNTEVTRIVMSPQFLNNKDVDAAANLLMSEAVLRWQKEQGMVDDTTIIVAYLNIDTAMQRHSIKTGIKLETEGRSILPVNHNMPVSPPSGAPD